VSCTPNPLGMTRVPRPGSRPPRWYDIKDGTQVVGQTERINESQDRYWRAWPAGGGAPRDFPHGRHQEEAMVWLRNLDQALPHITSGPHRGASERSLNPVRGQYGYQASCL
jgi:hypothetical protein